MDACDFWNCRTCFVYDVYGSFVHSCLNDVIYREWGAYMTQAELRDNYDFVRKTSHGVFSMNQLNQKWFGRAKLPEDLNLLSDWKVDLTKICSSFGEYNSRVHDVVWVKQYVVTIMKIRNIVKSMLLYNRVATAYSNEVKSIGLTCKACYRYGNRMSYVVYSQIEQSMIGDMKLYKPVFDGLVLRFTYFDGIRRGILYETKVEINYKSLCNLFFGNIDSNVVVSVLDLSVIEDSNFVEATPDDNYIGNKQLKSRNSCTKIVLSSVDAVVDKQLADIDNMQGYTFEQFCARLFRSLGYQTVCVTKVSADHGVDLTVVDSAGVKCAIQCKRYKKNVGNRGVQEIYTGSRLYNCNRAIILTNSGFTKQAIMDAERLGVELWDRSVLVNMIRQSVCNVAAE